MSAAPAELWAMTLKTGCVPLSDHLLRGQALEVHRTLRKRSREACGSCIED
jgi:hypothetical protein